MKAKVFCITAALSLLLFLSVAPVFAQLPTTCSDETLHGNYAFTIKGKIVPPGQTAFVAQQGVAMTNYDGDGKLTQVDFVMTNGLPAIMPSTVVNGNGFRESENGTYTVNPDCTGSLTINTYTTSNTLAATIQVKFVLAKGGREIREVVESITAFLPNNGKVNVPATILADGKKLGPVDNDRGD